jgi:hypothetical protein
LFGVPLAFKKNADTISIPQLMDGITKKDGEKLDHGTGLSRDAVVRAIKSLEEQNIIIRERRTDEHNADRPSTFRLNIIRGGSENKTLSGRKIVLSPVRLSDPQETVKPKYSFEYSKGHLVDFFLILWIPELIEEKRETMPSYAQLLWLSQCPQAVSSRLRSEADSSPLRLYCFRTLGGVSTTGLYPNSISGQLPEFPPDPFPAVDCSAFGVVLVTCWLREALHCCGNCSP